MQGRWTIYVCPVCGDWMGERSLQPPIVCGGRRGPHDQVECVAVDVVAAKAAGATP